MHAKFIFAIAGAVAMLVPDLGVAQAGMVERLAPGQPPVIAVTGRMNDTAFPDDSMAGLQWAIDRGVDLLAIRVQMTGDGEYIVFNDGTLTRMTNVRDVFPDGAPRRDPGDMVAKWHMVADYTLEEIKRLRLLDPYGGDHQVPTLNEALDFVDGRLPVLLALEGYDVDSLAALLGQRDTEALLLFDGGDLPKVAALSAATGIGVWASVVDAGNPLAAFEKRIEAFGPSLKVVDVRSSSLTPQIVAKADEHGVRLAVAGIFWEDIELKGGNTAPWVDALDSAAAVYWTEFPDTVLNLLDR